MSNSTKRAGRPQQFSDAALISMVQAVAAEVEGSPTIKQFNDSAHTSCVAMTAIGRFKTWNGFLVAAGLTARKVGRPAKASDKVATAEVAPQTATTVGEAAVIVLGAGTVMTPAEVAAAIQSQNLIALTAKEPRKTVQKALAKAVAAGTVERDGKGYKIAA